MPKPAENDIRNRQFRYASSGDELLVKMTTFVCRILADKYPDDAKRQKAMTNIENVLEQARRLSDKEFEIKKRDGHLAEIRTPKAQKNWAVAHQAILAESQNGVNVKVVRCNRRESSILQAEY